MIYILAGMARAIQLWESASKLKMKEVKNAGKDVDER